MNPSTYISPLGRQLWQSSELDLTRGKIASSAETGLETKENTGALRQQDRGGDTEGSMGRNVFKYKNQMDLLKVDGWKGA